MLEESLKNKDSSPSKTSAALQSFFCQEYPLGGYAAESLFLRLFPLLVERVLGPSIPLCDEEGLQKKIDNQRPWLFQTTKWPTKRSASDTSTLTYSSTTSSLDTDPVAQLLQPTSSSPFASSDSSFIQIMEEMESKRQRMTRRLGLPFLALPGSMQTAYYEMLLKGQAGIINSSTDLPTCADANSIYLWNQMSTSPNNQKDLSKNLLQTQRHAHGSRESTGMPLTPTSSIAAKSPSYSSPASTRGTNESSPFLSKQQQQQLWNEQNQLVPLSPITLKKIMELKCTALMSLWEFYFFSFIRYPLVMAEIASLASKRSAQRPASFTSLKPYGEQIYHCVLRSYLRWYLPHDFGERNMTSLARTSISSKSESFLRIMIAFWLEGNGSCVFPTTKDAVKNLTLKGADRSIGLDTSYDLSLLLPIPSSNPWESSQLSIPLKRQLFTPPSKQVQTCIRRLVNHLICDPSVSISNNGATDRFSELTWSLPHNHSVIQQSLYNYIRTMLRHASVHNHDSAFFSALDLWLLWIEPYNVVHRKRNKGHELLSSISDRVNSKETKSDTKSTTYATNTYPKATAPSKYSQKWEPYVAANFHFYTVPFSIFVRRAREFDFSDKLLRYVQRVFRVYSPSLVDFLETLVNKPGKYKKILEHHNNLLGDFCPPLYDKGPGFNEVNMSLSSLQGDMHTLLEEICLNHQKKVREQGYMEKVELYLESLFGTGTMTTDSTISKLIQSAKTIVRFSESYDVLKQSNESNAVNANKATNMYSISPEREANGLITEQGRLQILDGTRQCNTLDTALYDMGDPMYSRVKSYEMAGMVQISIMISEWLNYKFGLVAPIEEDSCSDEKFVSLLRQREKRRKVLFRFNLRFIADTRNLVSLLVIGNLFWKWFW